MIELSKSDPGKAKRIFDTFKEKLGKNQQALWHKAKNRANIIEEKYETQLEVELTKLVHEKCQQFESMRASPNSQVKTRKNNFLLVIHSKENRKKTSGFTAFH